MGSNECRVSSVLDIVTLWTVSLARLSRRQNAASHTKTRPAQKWYEDFGSLLQFLAISSLRAGNSQKLSFPVGIDKEKQALGDHEPSPLNRRLVVLWVLRQPRALCLSSFE